MRRFDCFSIWRRRTAKKRQREVIASLRIFASLNGTPEQRKIARAYSTAADILEKIADKYEQSGQDC